MYMTAIYDKNAKNISINSELLEKANWEKQNKEAIEDYNERVKQQGLFPDYFRSF